MAAQMNYGYSTAKGIAGGIYDMYHYKVDSRINEEENGRLRLGVGVVKGTIPGSGVKLPAKESTAVEFEGVIVNGFTDMQDMDGNVYVMKGHNVGAMREGRIWAIVTEGVTPAYGDSLYMDESGCFNTSSGVKISGRFIGTVNNGVAPIELYGVD